MVEYFKYKSYEEYLEIQRKKALLTKTRTSRACGERRRRYLYKRMSKTGVKGSTILCIGARDDSEILFFKERGYQTDGIDLYSTDNIIECDMSKIYEHPYFQEKKYDIVFSNESLEHCLDIDGFIKGLNLVCKRYFVCMCPVGDAGLWDCARHSFMEHMDDIEHNKKDLEECFSEFNVILNEIHKEGHRMFFILEKK